MHLRIIKKMQLTYLVLGQKHLKKDISCHGTREKATDQEYKKN